MKVINFKSVGGRHIVTVDDVRNEFTDFKAALKCVRDNAGGYVLAFKLLMRSKEKERSV